MKMRIGLVVAVLAVLALASGLALPGAAGESTSGVEELAAIADEISKEVPNVGLGEGSPPPDAAWKTDFSRHSVPLEEFQSGGPPKDGIPAIDEPRYTPARDVDFLDDREPVILVGIGDDAHAYPLQVLIWHEIVNARIDGMPVAVTFCPLCNTAIAFDRRVDGRTLDFGTTGKLRDSDLVMYDRQTESWWQQFGGEALVGELTGTELRAIPVEIVSWGEYRRDHPDGLVLNLVTGHSRPYGTNPYQGYDRIDSSPLFAVRNEDDDRLPPKERVVYVEVGDASYAVPFSALAKRRTIEIETDAGTLVVRWKPGVASALDEASIASGRTVGAASVTLDSQPAVFTEPFWFVVAAFDPDTEIVDE